MEQSSLNDSMEDDDFICSTQLNLQLQRIEQEYQEENACDIDKSKVVEMEHKRKNAHNEETPERNKVAKVANCYQNISDGLSRPFKPPQQLSLKQKVQDTPPKIGCNSLSSSEYQVEASQSDIGPFFGLPSKVMDLLSKNKGITELYKWQTECLYQFTCRKGQNLIYSLPTSGGKTLVAEVFIMKQMLCKQKNCIFILPYISIVQEKVRSLSPFAIELGFNIEEFAGNKGTFPPVKRRLKNSVYIATIEKGHRLINCLIENTRLDEIGMVVVDELHMIGEKSERSVTLETALAKIMNAKTKIQIVGMSATLGNISDLEKFLNAHVYCGDFRPVQLKELIKVEDKIWSFNSKEGEAEKQFQLEQTVSFHYTAEQKQMDPEYVTAFVEEIVPDNSCLVFCATKKHSENVAKTICKIINKSIVEHRCEDKKSLYNALKIEGNGIVCSILTFTIQYGIAYHHSGLTADERKLLEEAYSNGTLCCLCCTSTLAAGVNLPAKRVIIRTPYVGRNFLSRSRYKQMVGRAGRAGIDSSGESILIVRPSEQRMVQQMLLSPIETCCSNLMSNNGKGLLTLILSLIGLGLVKTVRQIREFFTKTLYFVQHKDDELCDFEQTLKDAVFKLTEMAFVRKSTNLENSTERELDDECEFEISKLGRATYKGSVNLDVAHRLYKDLLLASKSLNVFTSLHLLYLLSPYDRAKDIYIDNHAYYQAFMELSDDNKKVAEIIGINEVYAIKFKVGQRTAGVDEIVSKRFYVAMILYDLWNQKSIWSASEKYCLDRGVVQGLLSSSASFASCVFHFCQELEEFWLYQSILSNFVKKLSHCVTMELIPLMELPAVKKGRARLLYNAGYKTLEDVAKATVSDLVKKVEYLPKRVAHQIISSAKMLMLEKVQSLKEEAEDLMTVIQNVEQ